jgi:hypothetical protein
MWRYRQSENDGRNVGEVSGIRKVYGQTQLNLYRLLKRTVFNPKLHVSAWAE